MIAGSRACVLDIVHACNGLLSIAFIDVADEAESCPRHAISTNVFFFFFTFLPLRVFALWGVSASGLVAHHGCVQCHDP
jgi:hypothetical protein